MWLWSVAPAEAVEVVRFVAERRVRAVFLGVGWDGPEPHLVTLAHQLRTAGVDVQCLGGDPGWLAEPDLARQWLARAVSAGGFDAVHLDVEVWRCPGWADDRARLLEQYVTFLRAVREAGLPLEVDVAARFADDRVGTTSALDAVLGLGLADRVTVMAYRDHAEGRNGILEFSRSAREACSQHAVGFRLGVETQPAEQAGGPGNTFAEEGSAALERETAVVSSHLTANPFYRGIAVHDWQHWRRLP
jgi:hypothetical protein